MNSKALPLYPLAALLVLVLPAAAGAADNELSAMPGWGKLAQMLAALVFTLAVIYLLAWGLKRMRLLTPANTRVFNVVGTLALGTREKLYLVQVGQEQLVLGSSSKGLEALHVMQQPVAAADQPLAQGNAFGNVLAQFSREQK